MEEMKEKKKEKKMIESFQNNLFLNEIIFDVTKC